MNKEEHILYWAKQVDDDFDCANVLYLANHYAQSLFWAHLALEKLSKALWIKKNDFMLTKEIAITQATDFILACINYGIDIEKAIVFGSVAKNEQREYSDIDIALISSQFTDNFTDVSHLSKVLKIMVFR